MKSFLQNIIILSGGIILSLVLVVFAIRPSLARVSELHDLVLQQKTQLITLDQQILAFKTAQSDLSKAVRKDEIAQTIPDREHLVETVKDLEATAAITGSTESLVIDDAANKKNTTPPQALIPGHPGVDEVSYTLDVRNDYVGIIKMLSYLEHLTHFTEISKIDLSSANPQGSAGQPAAPGGKVFMNIKGVFFVKSNPSNP